MGVSSGIGLYLILGFITPPPSPLPPPPPSSSSVLRLERLNLLPSRSTKADILLVQGVENAVAQPSRYALFVKFVALTTRQSDQCMDTQEDILAYRAKVSFVLLWAGQAGQSRDGVRL